MRTLKGMASIKGGFLFYLKFHILFIILLKTLFSQAQVSGCPDPLANNYSSTVTINDGSCTYSPTSYTPPVKVTPINATLQESSGLQMAGNSLWSFNDGGGAPAIYRIDTLTNALLQTVTLSGASNVDWEDIAFDGTYFYIGDFGNNEDGARTDLKIYKFPLSAIPPYTTTPNAVISAGQIGIINFTYSDQPQPPVATTKNNTKYDCEAMFVDAGKIHLFTKNWVDLTTTHYIINNTTAGTYVAAPVETLATGYLVTGADLAIGKKFVALLGYLTTGFGNHFMHLLTGYSGGFYFNGNKRKLNLPDATVMGQAEGITFRDSVYGYISNEAFSFISVPQQLRYFNLSNLISGFPDTYTFTGDGDWNNPANWSNNLMPPATASPGSNIIIDPPVGKKCVLNIPYTVGPNIGLTVISGKSFVINDNLVVE